MDSAWKGLRPARPLAQAPPSQLPCPCLEDARLGRQEVSLIKPSCSLAPQSLAKRSGDGMPATKEHSCSQSTKSTSFRRQHIVQTKKSVLASSKGASPICSAAPRASLTLQLGREVRMLMANSPPGTSRSTWEGPGPARPRVGDRQQRTGGTETNLTACGGGCWGESRCLSPLPRVTPDPWALLTRGQPTCGSVATSNYRLPAGARLEGTPPSLGFGILCFMFIFDAQVIQAT